MRRIRQERGTEAFSVGIALRSRSLSVENFSAVAVALGAEWEDPTPKTLNPRLRSGIDGQLGAHLHVHLADHEPTLASSHLLIATAFLQRLEVLALRAADPATEFDVDVEQHIPDVGFIAPVHISLEAIESLVKTLTVPGDAIGIDQYGGDGYPAINKLLSPIIEKMGSPTETLHLEIEVRGENGETASFATSTFGRYDCAALAPDLTNRLEAWRVGAGAFTVTAARCILRQRVSMYRDSGIGYHLSVEFLSFLSDYRSDLTLLSTLHLRV